jgi:hypothetical protein
VGDLNTPLSPIVTTFRQKINKDILELNNTLKEMHLDIYNAFHHNTTGYKVFSAAHGTFSENITH